MLRLSFDIAYKRQDPACAGSPEPGQVAVVDFTKFPLSLVQESSHIYPAQPCRPQGSYNERLS